MCGALCPAAMCRVGCARDAVPAAMCAPGDDKDIKEKTQKKNTPGFGRVSEITCLFSKAVAAINRAVVAGLEGNLAGLTAFCAYCIKHLTSAAVAARAVALTSVPAGLAALRLIGEALFCKKLLLAGGESEFLSAILADDGFVLEH